MALTTFGLARFTADPEIKTTSGGTTICSFSVATNRNVSKGAEVQADFFNCISFRDTAENIAKFFSKGDMFFIKDGNFQNRNWTDDKGVKHYATDLVVNRFEFCGGKSSKEGAEEKEQEQPKQTEKPSAASKPSAKSVDKKGKKDLPGDEDGIDKDELPF